MLNRRRMIALLTAFNVVLFLTLLAMTTSLPKAFAQAGGGRDDFLAVTVKAGGQSYDVLYLLDVRDRKLHAFYPSNIQTAELAYVQFRDLKADFGRP